MSDELISQYLDRAAVTADTDFLIKELDRAQAKFDLLNKSKLNIAPDKPLTDISGGVQQSIKATNDLTAAQVKLTSAVKEKLVVNSKEYQDLLAGVEAKKKAAEAEKDGAKAAGGTTKVKKELTKADVEARLASQQRLAALKAEILLEQSSLGSINSKKAALASLQKSYDALGESQRESSEGSALLTDIANLDAELKKLEGDTGRFQRNVGNYASAFGGKFADAFAVLTKELESVRQKIQATEATAGNTAGLEKLRKEESLLTTITTNLGQTFTTPTSEMKAFTNAAKSIGQEFGIASDTFNEFVQEVGSKKDELDDIQATINFQASDTKYLDGVVTAVSGLAGAYGVAQSAQALWGEQDEEVQKQMVKLQAALTLVTSLQSVLNAIQTDGAAVQTAMAAKTALFNAAEKISIALSGQRIAVIEAETAALAAKGSVEETAGAVETVSGAATEATDLLTEAKEIQGAATEALSTVTEIQTVVTEGATLATEGATLATEGFIVAEEGAVVATVSLKTALIASGIGAIVIAIAAAVVYLVGKIQDWNAANASIIKANEALNSSLNDLISATKEYEAIRSLSAQNEIEDLEKLIERRKASGVTAAQALALDRKLAEEKLKFAKQDAQIYNITAATLKTAQDAARSDADVVRILEKQKRDFIKQTAEVKNADYEDEIARFDRSLDLRKKDAAASKAVFDFANDNLQKQSEASAQIDLLSTQAAKLNADERRKLVLETARIESEIITTKNSFILSNERSTLDERLAAIKSNAAEQRKLIQAELNDIHNDPTRRGTAEETIALKKAAADRSRITKETNKAIFDQTEADRKRELQAQLNFDSITLDRDKELQDKLAANQFLSDDARLTAIIESRRDQQAKIDAEYKHTRDTNILSATELLALDADHAAKTVALARATAEQIKAIQVKATVDHIEILKLEQKQALENQYSIDINALQKSFDLGLISQAQYNKERINLEYAFARASLAIEIDTLKKQLDSLELTKVQRANIEYEIAALERKLADDSLKYFEDNQKEKLRVIKDTFDQIGEIGNKVFGIIDGILNAGEVANKNKLKEQSDAAEAKAARDIELVNASVRSEQDKAAAIIIINARLAAQKEGFARKEKQMELDRARFAKAAAIFNIILSTAQAVIKAAPVIPLMVFAAVVGAAELAIAAATPVPKYRYGKKAGDGHQGIGIVNDHPDGRTVEVIERQDGSLEFPQGRNVLTHVGRNDIIHPDKDAWLNAILNAAHRDATAGMKFTPAKNNVEDKINATLMKGFASLSNVIRNKREIIIKGVSGKDIIFRDGSNSTVYLNQNLQG